MSMGLLFSGHCVYFISIFPFYRLCSYRIPTNFVRPPTMRLPLIIITIYAGYVMVFVEPLPTPQC